ncbi:MAG: tRNA (N6-isopentenyl adenosine(37)-C2)-methylthiotransferase MiaB [Acidobacteria bacterium]|nr:tRNA (N6-isopentenyl adenosine(37)-C2)-methylthiotransferase MiaB [Acidobacteriota bacterium]MBI3263123.1 tRNA (N6-isopentenyl adenosine(37)-C2)-methylthiotransferase MiaB [Acidobacteriota bacterium]
MSRRYFVETYGCQMNVHDSERMAGLLEEAGFVRAKGVEDADVVVINTCSVREKAEDKLYSRLGEIGSMVDEHGRRPLVAVAGCVAQQEGARLAKRSPWVDVIVGTQAIKMLPILMRDAAERDGRAPQVDLHPYENVSFPLGLARRGDRVKAYITIIEGCDEYCSFCVVPYTRGHERMRPKREIVAEVEEAVASGRREVQLLGQIVNHYRAPDDPGCDFAGLLEAIHDIRGLLRIRFASPHPRHVTPRLVEAIRDLPKVCRHLHLPVQSGSTRVLQSMRRRYGREDYLRLVDEVRGAVPAISISTDMIVGFPGETEADFADTVSLTEQVRFSSMFSFKYSERPNTLASKRMPDDVPEGVKGRRLAELQEVQRGIQTRLHEEAIGTEVDVLVDGCSRRRRTELAGRSSGNAVVNFPGVPELIGTLVTVSVKRAGPHSLWGEASHRPCKSK